MSIDSQMIQDINVPVDCVVDSFELLGAGVLNTGFDAAGAFGVEDVA